ncbi:MAG: 6-phosphofructo-2-kinase/fructose-2,6-bisphosphatase [Desulfatiglandaceae bacterium]
MSRQKLYIVMVGLPARGKTTIAGKLKENLERDGIRTRIFNNGQLRRRLSHGNTAYPEFYDPENKEGVAFREKIALMNISRAQRFIQGGGRVAILDATNVSLKRRAKIRELITTQPILFIECINNDQRILRSSIQRKVALPEFSHLSKEAAVRSFTERIHYYESIYSPLQREENFLKLDSLNNQILQEQVAVDIPFYDRIRDCLVTDIIRNLYLIRHGETYFNLENRIGGDSGLTENGNVQSQQLARYFERIPVPIIFTSKKKRTIQTAVPIKDRQETCTIIPIEEFNEIDSGVCECMSYEEIREQMPDVYHSRKVDKYNYIYPGGEGYVSMKGRVDRGIKKALFLSSNSLNIMIIGHRAVNRMILSHFLYRRMEDVPYIYVPQDKFYHIVATLDKKLFQLKRYGD